LTSAGAADVCETATLLVSELVTNSVLHARSPVDVVVAVRGTVVRVEVVDRSAHPPTRRHYSAEAGTGRGLVLVEELSAAWGVTASEGGKSVWFELDRRNDGSSIHSTHG
jgi:hypothetical protein